MRAAVPSLPEIGHSAADIGRTAAEFARRSPAPATESAYASDWADFSAWCNSAERLALPADPTTIGAYLSDRSGILKVSTLNRRLAAITAMHRLGGHGLDGKHPAIALVLAGIRRTYGTRQVAKRALLTEDLRRIVRRLRIDTPGGCRDRALLLVCFGAAMRRSELIALDVDDITITQAGLTLLVRRSKTDQEGQGREIGIPRSRKSATCPVAALEAWLALAKSPIDSTYQEDREHIRNKCVAAPLFTRVDHGRITGDRLTGRAVAESRSAMPATRRAWRSWRTGSANSRPRRAIWTPISSG
jgi:integrase